MSYVHVLEQKQEWITYSNYDGYTFILQQGLQLAHTFNFMYANNKDFDRKRFIWDSPISSIDWTTFLPELPEQREAILYPDHMNLALEPALWYPWKMKNLQLLHERSFTKERWTTIFI